MNKVVVRSISGTVFILVMLAGLLLDRFLFATLVGFIGVGMIWELVAMCKSKKLLACWIPYIILSVAVLFFLGFPGGEFSGKLLLAFFIMIWSSDVGAFCVGSLLGQKAGSRKLAPSISPNKSWVGFWGGLVFTVAAGVILHYTGMLAFPVVHCVVLAVIVHCFGVCGDLMESALKRYCGVKDSGNLIPGHGGLLDRFDSTLLAVPAGALYLFVFRLL